MALINCSPASAPVPQIALGSLPKTLKPSTLWFSVRPTKVTMIPPSLPSFSKRPGMVKEHLQVEDADTRKIAIPVHSDGEDEGNEMAYISYNSWDVKQETFIQPSHMKTLPGDSAAQGDSCPHTYLMSSPRPVPADAWPMLPVHHSQNAEMLSCHTACEITF